VTVCESRVAPSSNARVTPLAPVFWRKTLSESHAWSSKTRFPARQLVPNRNIVMVFGVVCDSGMRGEVLLRKLPREEFPCAERTLARHGWMPQPDDQVRKQQGRQQCILFASHHTLAIQVVGVLYIVQPQGTQGRSPLR